MNSKTKILTFFLPTLAISALIPLAVNAQTKLNNQSKVFINGIGAVKVGMTVSQATRAAGTRLVQNGVDTSGGSCFYVKPEGSLNDVAFMVTKGRISRIDVFKNSRVATVKGARVGDTEARIKSLYPGQIQITRHKYTNGHYLIFVPKDQADKNFRLVFETDGDRVTQFRSGKMPEVQWVEGCA
jgi:hypothetical protein